MSPSDMSLTASKMSSFTGEMMFSFVGVGDLNPFLSGVRWFLLTALGDLLLGDLERRDPLTDVDLSLLNLGEGDMDGLLRGDDLGDASLLDPEEFSEVLS